MILSLTYWAAKSHGIYSSAKGEEYLELNL